MKHLYKIVMLCMLPLVFIGCKKNEDTPKPQKTITTDTIAPVNFRVVGYMQSWQIDEGDAANYDMAKINYLNIAFYIPNKDGSFSPIQNIDDVIASAHKSNVKVMLSLGGGSTPAYITSFLKADVRAVFIDSLMNLVAQHNYDGIDVDLEGDRINSDYEGFVGDLSVALKAKNKLLTAAIATWEKDSFTDKALTYFDFVNVMSYDKTGPWDPSDPGPHAPYSMAVNDLDYWGTTRGIAKERLNLGLPFYGYGFGNGVKANYNYIQVIHQFPDDQDKDQITVAAGGTIYYNGIPTIKRKCKLALTATGGVMIWDLLSDVPYGDKSLLNAINNTLNGK
jgi:chitinase